MVLSTDDIVAWRVNWEPKSVNIAAIADELNLGLDSVVLIDDQLRARRVAGGAPGGAHVADPRRSRRLPRLIASTGWFRAAHLGGRPSAHRDGAGGALAQRRQSRRLRRGLPRLAPAPRRILPRPRLPRGPCVTQLINKTNQFNLTTRRRIRPFPAPRYTET